MGKSLTELIWISCSYCLLVKRNFIFDQDGLEGVLFANYTTIH
jgi:hypothetical protein